MEPAQREGFWNESTIKLLIPLLIMLAVIPVARWLYPTPTTIADAYSYTMTAQRLVSDGYFSFGPEPPGTDLVPNARVTPGWPLVLSAVYAVSGMGPDPASSAIHAYRLLSVVMALASLGIVLMVSLSARLLGGDDAGLLAGLLAALYLPFTWAGTVTLSTHIGTLLFAVQIYLALKLSAKKAQRDMSQMFLFGATVGLTLMFRPHLALWSLVPLIYLIVRRLESPVRLFRIIIVTAIGFCLVFAPWWTRNAIVFGTFVPIKTDSLGKLEPQRTALTPAPASSSAVDPYWEKTDLREDLLRTAQPWVPFFETLWEVQNDTDELRIEYPDASVAPVTWGDTAAYAMLWFHRFILACAASSLLFLKRFPRLAMLVMAPVAVYLPYWDHLTTRHLHPTMVAAVIMAAVGIYGAIRFVRAKVAG